MKRKRPDARSFCRHLRETDKKRQREKEREREAATLASSRLYPKWSVVSQARGSYFIERTAPVISSIRGPVESKSRSALGPEVASEHKHPYVHDLEFPFDLLPLSRRISLWSPGGRYHLP